MCCLRGGFLLDERLEMYQKYSYLVPRLVERYKLTEDEAQELHLRLWEMCESVFTQSSPASTWLALGLNHTVVGLLRKRRREDVFVFNGLFLNDLDTDLEMSRVDDRLMCYSLLVTAQSLLSEREFTMLYLHLMDGVPLSDIGELMGITKSRVWTVIKRSIVRIRRYLAYHGGLQGWVSDGVIYSLY